MHIEDGLDKLLLGQYDEALDLFAEGRHLPQAEKLYQLALMLSELSAYAFELSKVNLSAKVPVQHYFPATSLKNLHAKLKRFARESMMATTGYPVATIDYMGDLSGTLDFLVGQALLHKQQAEHARDHDVETGLLNRRAFIRKVYDILQEQPNKSGVLFCCILDNIKYINEAHGYDCGDLYINKVVEVLRSCENPFYLLSRVSGNEFAVYAHGFDNERDAYCFARGIFKALFTTKVALLHEEVSIRTSCGVALYPHDAVTSDVLMSYAGHAMFEVRNLNRGTMMRFSPEIYRTKTNLNSWQDKLDELIEGKLIRFAFQPIVNLQSAQIFGYEALMRPKTDIFTDPLDVLSLAESASKLRQIEKLTFEVLFEWIYDNIELLKDKKIFFNTISEHYLDIAELRNIHPQYETISTYLVFEIMETAAIEGNLLEKIHNFRKELSSLFAIDDFGRGHLNALRLMSISPDMLKIDRFFIGSIQNAPATKKELLSNILAYCRAKEIQTVAEGVETREELAGVISMGFDFAQGYYLGRPEPYLADLRPDILADIVDLAKKSPSGAIPGGL
jgi:diguanylate cyclase (GGDEF)-like protein